MLLGKPLMERSLVFSFFPRLLKQIKKPGKLPHFNIYYQTLTKLFCENKLSVVIKGFSSTVSLCRDLFLFRFYYTKQFTGATCRDYSEIAQL